MAFEPLSLNLDGAEYSLNIEDQSPSTSRAITEFAASVIHPSEIVDLQHLGGGGYGRVMKCRWRRDNKLVAVKYFGTNGNTETERYRGLKHCLAEVRQLLRLQHENIVQFYGHSPPDSRDVTYIVLEYMCNGSLYDVMHNDPHVEYCSGHAHSWLMQTANAVNYLHNKQPPMIHRDLKPPNLLLCDHGRTLKICDFGTAVDFDKSTLTNNRGTACWMAPEVFEGYNRQISCSGNKYTTKCDVYSFGIIMWELFTRQKPFRDLGEQQYAICWNVHQGKRPPPIENCPEEFQALMQRCWVKEVNERPTMSQIIVILRSLEPFFPGGEQKLRLNCETNVEEVPMESVNPMSPVPRPGSVSFHIDGVADRNSSRNYDSEDGRTPTKKSMGSGNYLQVHVVETPLQSVVGTSSDSGLGLRRHSSGCDLRAAAVVRNAHSADPTANVRPIPPKRNSHKRRAGGSYETALLDLTENPTSTDDLANDVQTSLATKEPDYSPLVPIPGHAESHQVYADHLKLISEYRAINTERTRLRQEKEDLKSTLRRQEQYQKMYNEFERLSRRLADIYADSY